MITRIVNFRLKNDQDSARFVAHARQIFPTIPGVVQFTAFEKAEDAEFGVIFNVEFENLEAVETYKTHPIHVEFVENWSKVYAEKYWAKNYR